VGVVDHHEEPLPASTASTRPGTPRTDEIASAATRVVDPERPGGRERGQGVLDVERPAQRRADRHPSARKAIPSVVDSTSVARTSASGASPYVIVGRPEAASSAAFVIEVHDGAVAHRRL
jgi:hypothetical protein